MFFDLTIAVITCNSNLEPLLEGLCSLNSCRFEFLVFWIFCWNRIDDLGINSPALWPSEIVLHRLGLNYWVRSICCTQHSHYWVRSICCTQHSPRALLACHHYLLVTTYYHRLLHLLLLVALRKPGSRSLRFGGHPGEGLSNQTLAGLVVLWITKLPRFTRGINPMEYCPRVLRGGTTTSCRSSTFICTDHV